MTGSVSLEIGHTWDGRPIGPGEAAVVSLWDRGFELEVAVEAPFHDDPSPNLVPGRAWRLWEFEVVELFVLGPRERYLELEIGPHGHYLLLLLEGRRRIVSSELELESVESRIEGTRWRARALVASALLPWRPWRVNAFAMHGSGHERRHLAWAPVPGPAPDFHRLESYRRFPWSCEQS